MAGYNNTQEPGAPVNNPDENPDTGEPEEAE